MVSKKLTSFWLNLCVNLIVGCMLFKYSTNFCSSCSSCVHTIKISSKNLFHSIVVLDNFLEPWFQIYA